MRATRIISAAIILLAFGLSSLSGQALVRKDMGWYLQTYDGIYPSEQISGVFTPSENINMKQLFIITNPKDRILPDKGVNKVNFKTRFRYNGEWWFLYATGNVFPDGKVWIVFHFNGKDKHTDTKDHSSNNPFDW